MNRVERMATRAENACQHPGRSSQPRKRRNKEEMAWDRAIEEEKKEQKRCQQKKGIAHIAELEDRMAIDDAGVEGAHPRNQKGSLLFVFFSALLGYLYSKIDIIEGSQMKRKSTDVNSLPLGKPNLGPRQVQVSAVTGSKPADQKQKRVEPEEEVLDSSGKVWYEILNEWIINEKKI